MNSRQMTQQECNSGTIVKITYSSAANLNQPIRYDLVLLSYKPITPPLRFTRSQNTSFPRSSQYLRFRGQVDPHSLTFHILPPAPWCKNDACMNDDAANHFSIIHSWFRLSVKFSCAAISVFTTFTTISSFGLHIARANGTVTTSPAPETTLQ